MYDFDCAIKDHINAVSSIDKSILSDIAKAIVECFNNGGKLYVCGNGGSAADAQHISAEIVGRYKKDRKALPCIALTTDSSILTAVSNDFGYENVFIRQIEALMTSKDILWVLTTSGRSVNITEAIKTASSIGSKTILFTGSNKFLNTKCSFALNIQSTQTNIIQECHVVAYHSICDMIENY